MLLLFATPSSAALEFETDTEVRDATYNTEPTQSLEAGVPDGIPEEMLETEGETTRAQFLTMLVNLANPELDTVQSTSFPDVPENAYYALQVSWAKANGIINGTAAGVLEPDTSLTRNEAAVMAARLAKAMGCDAAPLSSRKNSANMPSHGAFLLLHGPLESGQKSEQALSLLAVCGSLNADSVLAPKGGKNYFSHWLSR